MVTIAGNGSTTFSGDGGPATAAGMNTPARLAYDGAAFLYVTDQFNNVVRQINLNTGIISSVAGNNTASFSGDGGPATAAGLSAPAGVAITSSGLLYIADANNKRIRATSIGVGSVAIIASQPKNVCAGTTINFAAFCSASGIRSYQWLNRGTSISGATSSTWSYSSPATGDSISCAVLVTPYCTGTYGISSNVLPFLADTEAAAISGDTSPLCSGSSRALSNATPSGSWSSSNTSVATVGTSGTVAGISTGAATISYTVSNHCGTSVATASLTVESCTGMRPGTDPATAGEPAGNMTITISPNPNAGICRLHGTTDTPGPVSLQLTAISGKVVYSNSSATPQSAIDEQLEFGSLPPGLYLLRVRWATASKLLLITVER
jgi:hypothetical protein